MRMIEKYFVMIVIPVLLFISSCSTVPITGRAQLSLVPESSMLKMSYQQYDDFLKSHKISVDKTKTAVVKRVGGRIKAAVERFFVGQGMRDGLGKYDWEFNLIENSEVNAWCMPGGKVVVYTGILPVTQDEEGLAVVIGHEVGHAVAGHGAERMSHLLAVQMGGLALAVAMAEQPAAAQDMWFTAYGMTSQVGVILPYSRLQEYEADRLGLIFMSMAGYDPHRAVKLWQKMASLKKGKTTAAFLSTHPSDESRIKKIEESLPEAMRYFQAKR